MFAFRQIIKSTNCIKNLKKQYQKVDDTYEFDKTVKKEKLAFKNIIDQT